MAIGEPFPKVRGKESKSLLFGFAGILRLTNLLELSTGLNIVKMQRMLIGL
jgi:hypothetical protein